MELGGKDFASYQMLIRDANGYYTMVEPHPISCHLPITKKEALRLYGGMHFLNDFVPAATEDPAICGQLNELEQERYDCGRRFGVGNQGPLER